MLRSVRDLRNHVLSAKDGPIGRCKDFLFDDGAWTIRYMVADTGRWLPKKRVLISPVSLGEPDWRSQVLRVTLTKREVENSPPLDADAPVSREYERTWYEHYNWSPYWYGGGIWGAGPLPQALLTRSPKTGAATDTVESPHHNLRSAEEVTGYHIQASDGEIGHVEDFIIDDSSWTVRYVVVDTRNWLPGRKVLVSPTWVTRIDWAAGDVFVDLTQDLIKRGPEYDPVALDRTYEERLFEHYGRKKYWEE